MKNYIFMTMAIFVAAGCSTAPKCGSAANSETVFSDSKSCEVRIRQVLVASRMNLPNSVKSGDLTTWELEWSGSDLINGQIRFGHFVLRPPQVSEKAQ